GAVLGEVALPGAALAAAAGAVVESRAIGVRAAAQVLAAPVRRAALALGAIAVVPAGRADSVDAEGRVLRTVLVRLAGEDGFASARPADESLLAVIVPQASHAGISGRIAMRCVRPAILVRGADGALAAPRLAGSRRVTVRIAEAGDASPRLPVAEFALRVEHAICVRLAPGLRVGAIHALAVHALLTPLADDAPTRVLMTAGSGRAARGQPYDGNANQPTDEGRTHAPLFITRRPARLRWMPTGRSAGSRQRTAAGSMPETFWILHFLALGKVKGGAILATPDTEASKRVTSRRQKWLGRFADSHRASPWRFSAAWPAETTRSSAWLRVPT